MSEQPQGQQPQQPTPQPPPSQPPYQPPYQPPGPPPYKRLTRSRYDAPISGVCGGIAKYLGVDPTLVRVLAVIAAVITFPVGPIVYAVLWAVIPQE
jgi:phage shock protein PspC (stress-responsive transcriptional regulator)